VEEIMKEGMPEIKINGDLFEYAAFFLTKFYNKKYVLL
jgi:hypothetical protein